MNLHHRDGKTPWNPAQLSKSDIGKQYVVFLKNGEVFFGCLTNVGTTEVEFNGWVWVGREDIVGLVHRHSS